MKNRNQKLYVALGLVVFWIDLFCGAGGTSTGISLAKANAVVVACVNHDEMALKSHKENHPNCEHFQEDITNFNVVIKLKAIVDYLRKKHPFCKINIFASPDCTHHSGAAGGTSRDADSRSLANHLFMYLDSLKPDCMYIENVKEFLTWGPLRLKEGKNSTADYCELAQDRLKKKFYINIPDPKYKAIYYNSWRDTIINEYGFDYEYQLLNSADFGEYTSRPRYFGIFAKSGYKIKFPIATHNKFGTDGKQKYKAVKEVLELESKGNSVFSKKRAPNTYKRILGGLKVNTDPYFMTNYNGNGKSHSVDNPCNVIATKERFALHFIQYDYSNAYYTSMDEPAGGLTCNPKHNFVTIDWLMDMQYKRVSMSIEHVGCTLLASQHKKPLYFLSAQLGYPENFLNDDDCPELRELKEYMILHGIKDVSIRMLYTKELLRIQGFPEGYILKGTKAQQNKFIGNSVVPLMAQLLIEENEKMMFPELVIAA